MFHVPSFAGHSQCCSFRTGGYSTPSQYTSGSSMLSPVIVSVKNISSWYCLMEILFFVLGSTCCSTVAPEAAARNNVECWKLISITFDSSASISRSISAKMASRSSLRRVASGLAAAWTDSVMVAHKSKMRVWCVESERMFCAFWKEARMFQETREWSFVGFRWIPHIRLRCPDNPAQSTVRGDRVGDRDEGFDRLQSHRKANRYLLTEYGSQHIGMFLQELVRIKRWILFCMRELLYTAHKAYKACGSTVSLIMVTSLGIVLLALQNRVSKGHAFPLGMNQMFLEWTVWGSI